MIVLGGRFKWWILQIDRSVELVSCIDGRFWQRVQMLPH